MLKRVGLGRALRVAVVAVGLQWCAGRAEAQVAWDPGHTPDSPSGGSGIWDYISPNWANSLTDSDQVWFSATAPAVFGGVGGTISVSLGIDAPLLDFQAGGYTLAGSGTVPPMMARAIQQEASVSGTNVIALPIQSVGDVNVNGGTLRLTNTNPTIPNIYFDDRIIQVAPGAALEFVATPASSAVNHASIELNSATLRITPIDNGSGSFGAGVGVALTNESTILLQGDQFTKFNLQYLSFAPNSTVHILGNPGKVLSTSLGYEAGVNVIDTQMEVEAGPLVDVTPAELGTVLLKTGPATLSIESLYYTVDQTNLTFDARQGALQIKGGRFANNAVGPALQISGGTLSLNTDAGTPFYNDPLNVTTIGGELDIQSSLSLGSPTYGVSVAGPLTINTAPSDASSPRPAGVIAGPITGTGSITKTGAGSLILSGVGSDYAGPTHVTGGTLYVTGSIASSPISTDSGASLGGTGTISSPVTILPGGSLAPSQGSGISPATPATLTLLGDVQFADATTKLLLDLAAGTYDQVLFGGSMSLNGAELVLTSDASAVSPALAGEQYWILDGLAGSGPVAGLLSYDGAALPNGAVFTVADGMAYQIQYNASGDPNGTGDDVLLTPVPEMGSGIALLIAGAVGLLARRGRSRRLNVRA